MLVKEWLVIGGWSELRVSGAIDLINIGGAYDLIVDAAGMRLIGGIENVRGVGSSASDVQQRAHLRNAGFPTPCVTIVAMTEVPAGVAGDVQVSVHGRVWPHPGCRHPSPSHEAVCWLGRAPAMERGLLQIVC